jgi:C1A family cysteine protease
MTSSNIPLNYKFQEIDKRDYIHPACLTLNAPTPVLPKSIIVPNTTNIVILNQGNLGSCVSNAFIQCINVMTNKLVFGSRLFMYFNGRAVANYPLDTDTGLTVRDGCKSISNYGLCGETIYPYNISLFAMLPSLQSYQKSLLFKNFTYYFVNQNIDSIKNCLNTTKNPIIFGINVYTSFMSNAVATTGIVPMPNMKTEQLEGGHCVIMIGYDDSKQWVICMNSWGTGWGNKGLFYLPYAYIMNSSLSSDFCSLSFNFTALPTSSQVLSPQIINISSIIQRPLLKTKKSLSNILYLK